MRVLAFVLKHYKQTNKQKKKKIGLFLLIILNGKENEKALANLSQPRKLRAKMKSQLRSFCKRRNPKTLNIRLRATLNTWKKFCESLKESRATENIPANELDLFTSPFVNKMAGTEYEPRTLNGFQRSFQFNAI